MVELIESPDTIFKRNHKFLLIEDDPIIQRLYRTKLQMMDQFVIEANTGERGLALLNSEKPDLVMLDVNLPDMDGFEVLKAIKNKGIKIPVIVLTNQENEEKRKEALELGAADYLIKAMTIPRDLMEKLRLILEP